MTKSEKLIVSAYTGVLMVSESDFRKFAEGVLKRQIQDYEFVIASFWEVLRQKTKNKFMDLCKGE